MGQSCEEDVGKRTANAAPGHKAAGKTKGPILHEIIVQRLASEPDNKQVYKPIQPREFVSFDYEEMTLLNLKKACAAHFKVPHTTCDVLVTNKGPSCTNVNQIQHRKDKVCKLFCVLLISNVLNPVV